LPAAFSVIWIVLIGTERSGDSVVIGFTYWIITVLNRELSLYSRALLTFVQKVRVNPNSGVIHTISTHIDSTIDWS